MCEAAGLVPAAHSQKTAGADQLTHDESEIEATSMNQHALQDVRVAAQMRTAHAPRVIEVRERAFDRLTASPHQAPSASSLHPAAIAIDRRLRVRRLRPVAAASVRLGDVRPDTDRVEVHHRLVAVIPLVADQFVQCLWRLDVPLRVFDLLGRGRHRFDDRRRVALVGALQRDGDNGAGVQVDRMLGFVGQMRPAVFHLRDLRIGVVRVGPLLVRRLLLALLVHPCQVLARRGLDPRGRGEPGQKRLIALAGVAPHDAAHRGVRLERGGIDRHGLPLEQSRLDESLLHPREDGAVRLDIDQAPRPRDRRMIGRGVLLRTANESVARHAIPRSESMPSK